MAKPGMGDNSVNKETRTQLRSFIERLERLAEEKKAISEDEKDVLGEAKGFGFDTKTIKTILKIRKADKQKRFEEQSLLETYMVALGMELYENQLDDDHDEDSSDDEGSL